MRKKIILSVLVSVILYLFTSFIKWDILWILEIPKYNWDDRLTILLFYICFQAIGQLLINT